MITVIITLLNDTRVFTTLASLSKQTVKPDSVIILDGGSESGFIENVKLFIATEKLGLNVSLRVYKGTIGQTRKMFLDEFRKVGKKEDILVIIDADECAPKEWLCNITTPLRNKDCDFCGGPTQPMFDAKNKCEEFINYYDDWFYKNIVEKDITTLPMGNSAWKAEIFKKIGSVKPIGSEDIDLNLRAVRSGFKGKLIKDAFLFHDQSHLNTLWKIFKRKYTYSSTVTSVYLSNDNLIKRTGTGVSTIGCLHPIELMNLIAKAFGAIRGFMLWRKET